MAAPRAGTEVYIQVQLNDLSQASRPLYDPATSVTMILKNPSGSTILNNVAMTRLSTGIYYYRYQTSTGSPLGRWTVSFTGNDGAATHKSHNLEAFELVGN
jgi:uncharacterized protein YfaS (alpha-2-macroglobulin family)